MHTLPLPTPPIPPQPRPRCSHCHNPTPLLIPSSIPRLLRTQRGTSYLVNSLPCYLAILDAEVRDTSPGKGRQSPVEERILFPCSVCRQVTFDGEPKRARTRARAKRQGARESAESSCRAPLVEVGHHCHVSEGDREGSGPGIAEDDALNGIDDAVGSDLDLDQQAPQWSLTPCPAEVGWLVCGRCWGKSRGIDAGGGGIPDENDFGPGADILHIEVEPLDLDRAGEGGA